MKTYNPPRPSATGRFLQCASSALPPQAPHDPDTDAARGGSAVHHAIAHAVANDAMPDDEVLEDIAIAYGVEPADVTVPFALWRRAWSVLHPYFPAPEAEVRVDGPLNGGTADLVSVTPERITIADWKSGRSHGDHEHQMACYAHALRDQHGMPTEGVIRAAVVHLRHQYWHVWEFDDRRLDAFGDRFESQLRRVGDHYAAGEHCGFCPRRLECPTRAAYVRTAIATLTDRGELDAAGLAALYPAYQAARQALDEYRTALTAALAAGGPVPVGDGLELGMQQRVRQKIRAREAWPILRESLSDAELAGAVSIGKTAMLAALKAKAARGEKGRVAAEMMERLAEAGAVEEKPEQSLQLRKAGQR